MQRSAKAPDAPDPLAQGTHQTTVLASRALGRSSDRRRVAEARERQRLGELRPVHPIALRDVPGELLEGQMCARIVALIGKKTSRSRRAMVAISRPERPTKRVRRRSAEALTSAAAAPTSTRSTQTYAGTPFEDPASAPVDPTSAAPLPGSAAPDPSSASWSKKRDLHTIVPFGWLARALPA